jgi:excisionase family DNA binding protein
MPGDDTSIDSSEEEKSWLTTEEVAGILGIHQNTVRRWSDMGVIKSFRVSQRVDRWYRYEDITIFLDDKNEQEFGKY